MFFTNRQLVGLLALFLVADASGPDDLPTYQAAAAKIGRDADAHVRLACWCEAHGLSAQRHKHLALRSRSTRTTQPCATVGRRLPTGASGACQRRSSRRSVRIRGRRQSWLSITWSRDKIPDMAERTGNWRSGATRTG